MKDKLYLKTPYKEHKDLTVPVTVLKYPNSPTDEYIVYSPLIDNTFSIGIDNVKTTPVDSEYVVDRTPREKLKDLSIGTSSWYKEKLISLRVDKRFYAACAAMQGILANERLREKLYYKEKAVEYSYNVADELLKQENL